MSIAIIFNNKGPGIWKQKLKETFMNTTVEVYPEIRDKEKVEFILCWKPEVGVLSEFPNLKVVQSVGASVEHILKTQKLDGSIIISRIVDKNLSIDMFEFILSSILMKMKNFNKYFYDKEHEVWSQKKYQSINNTRVTILGLGKIGSYVSERLADMGFTVKGWSNSQKNIRGVESYHGKEDFKKSVEDSDFLINLLPLTSETENILNTASLRLLNKAAFLINVGRGEHLVENDLINLLNTQYLSGAILDVFREEPLPKQHVFWKHPNITITPHVASLTNVDTAIDLVAENYNRFLNKKELLHIVSLKKGY
ncbi:2-hydroxyacid dehydrogenase [Tenacibaculum aiptasiae]|uniref:2-hydroxyacid dehydrogenase n=1 Tax=Tenacibaculum aiptasiae TaxID=426481 RepID=UPI00232B6DE6|nr:glyoxylate/hydroxypyruvate reductase A [Tenacibaculum aiptasiae]